MPGPLQLDVIRASALIASLGWAAGSAGLLLTPRSLATRLGWAAGWVVLCGHVLIAFGVAHGWSHAAAFDHAERTAGVGAGVYVNEAFLLAWASDAGWLLFAPRHYAGRPRWVGWAVHGFLAFIVFNATVVYGGVGAKVVGGAIFAGLAGVAVHGSRMRRRPGSTPREGKNPDAHASGSRGPPPCPPRAEAVA